MTLTLSPEIEKALTEAAARQGTTPDDLITKMVQEKFAPTSESREDRKARIHALVGSMAYLGPSRLLQDRAEDRLREERDWQK